MIPKHVFEETLLVFLAPVRPFLDDPAVTEIMINGPSRVYVERKGKIEHTSVTFPNAEAILCALRNAAQAAGKHIDEERPILEARLPDGSRLEAVIPPIAADGPFVSIRRFSKDTFTLGKLIELGSLTPLAAELLETLVRAKLNILIAGGTGSGKTSLLNLLAALVPDDERIIVIEDSREIQVRREHVLSMEARPADREERGQVSIRDLFRASLRMRPDRLVIGEIRGGEALDIIQAMVSGHGGCLGTLHATYPRDTLTRLETMAMMSDVEMPLFALRAQVGSAIDGIVQTARLQDGSRCITHITQVLGYDQEKGYRLEDMFVRRFHGKQGDGRVLSEFLPTGALPQNLEMIRALGLELPAAMYRAYEQSRGGR